MGPLPREVLSSQLVCLCVWGVWGGRLGYPGSQTGPAKARFYSLALFPWFEDFHRSPAASAGYLGVAMHLRLYLVLLLCLCSSRQHLCLYLYLIQCMPLDKI